MNKWFTNVKTLEELRKQYRILLKKFHPDNENGSVEITQEINAEFDVVASILNEEKHTDSQSYTQEENEQFKVILNAIIGYNITIEIIGNWIWCFNCYAYKDQLKLFGFTWCSKKKAWVFHDGEYHRHHKKEIPLSHIRAKYGSKTVRNQAHQYSLN